MQNPKLETTDRARQAKPPKHPLVGAGLHWRDERGYTQNQATIVAVIPSGNAQVGDLALIQYFEWIIGGISTRRLVALSELASSEQWVLYSSVDEMNDHYERVDEHRNDHIRRNADNGGANAKST